MTLFTLYIAMILLKQQQSLQSLFISFLNYYNTRFGQVNKKIK